MTDEQWIALVEMWSSPKHKERCLKNIENRGKVRFAQTTGSRCFIAHTHVVKQNKYKDVQPTAIDLLKDLHCSSKTGFDEPMKEALVVSNGYHDGSAYTRRGTTKDSC